MLKANKYRERPKGIRICRRCKEKIEIKKGKSICDICKKRCSTCGIKLNPRNIDSNCKKLRKAYRCKKCVADGVERTVDPINHADYKLQKAYGISLKEYEELLKIQNGKCAICGRLPGKKRLHVDHKHLKGERQIKKEGGQALMRSQIRGILCWECNGALGKFHDNPELLRKAANYLESNYVQKLL